MHNRTSSFSLLISALCGAFLLPGYALAGGALDDTWGGTGKLVTDMGGYDYAGRVIQQSDGKLVATGSQFAIARYNQDGALDTSFSGDGKVINVAPYEFAHDIVQQPDNKLVFFGISSNYAVMVARYNGDGSLDNSFGSGGNVTTTVGSYPNIASGIRQDDGKLVAAGSSTISGVDYFTLVRYQTNGALDTSFDGDGIVTTAVGSVHNFGQSLIQQQDGKLLLAGRSSSGSSTKFALVRYNLNGSLDTSLGGTGSIITSFGSFFDDAFSVTQQSDGKLVVAGSSYDGDKYLFAVARYNLDGSLDGSFGSGGKLTTVVDGNDEARSIIQQSDGKLVVAGYSNPASGVTHALLARYNSDGTLDSSFGKNGRVVIINGTDAAVYSVVQQADGKLLASGSSGDSSWEFFLARVHSGFYDGDADAIDDGVDNCLGLANSDQAETDGDGIGDACDPTPNIGPTPAVDTDTDGMDDNWEYFYGLQVGFDDGAGDNDGDGLTNLQEYNAQANPYQTDSDFDSVQDGEDFWPNDNTRARDHDANGLSDEWEDAHGVWGYPALGDPDSDGLNNSQEYETHTNPQDNDSDNDGLNDGADKWPNNKLYNNDADDDGLPDRFEILNAPSFKTTPPYLNYNNASDATQDADGDTLSNVQEFNTGTDWSKADTDGDGVNDNLDVAPLNPAYSIDSDGDGLPDEYEIQKGLAPFMVEGPWEIDMDNDGLTNLQEYLFGTEPTGLNCGCNPQDSDNDGVPDGEDRYPLDPLEQRDWDMDGMPDNWENYQSIYYGFYDLDNDGLKNLYEYLAGTDPRVSDSDMDGVQDGLDAWPIDNTRRWDMDADGLPDDWEDAHGLPMMDPSTLLDDWDGDGLFDWQEYEAQTNPRDSDSDNDGLDDGADKWPNNKLYNTDSDNDGLPDRFEILNAPPFKAAPPFLNVNNAGDATQDADGDTLNNLQEFNAGTDWSKADTDGDGVNDNLDVAPLNPAYSIDSDGDGLPDEYEIQKGLAPFMVEGPWEIDMDNDGLTNLQEYLFGTEPTGLHCGCNPQYSDNDGVPDGEDRYPLDPDEWYDGDMDGMPDGWEWQHGLGNYTNDGFADPDMDGVTNLYEYLAGTDPQDTDSDNDAVQDGIDAWPTDNTKGQDVDYDLLPDGWEIAHGLSIMPGPFNFLDDTDGDGLYDWQEYDAQTNPRDGDSDNDGLNDGTDKWPNNKLYNTDSDNDGLPDRFEILNNAPIKTVPPFLNSSNASDAIQDADGDTLTNVQEFNAETDWSKADTDGDGVNDNVDVAPLNAAYTIDSDGDGLPDEYEIEKGLDPLMVEESWEEDMDNDSLTNLQEYLLGTEPTYFNCSCDPRDSDGDMWWDGQDRYPLDFNEMFDSDLDGMPDGWEWQHGLGNYTNDGFADPDMDSVTNLYEYLAGTDPQDTDSDNDAVQDGIDAWPTDNTKGQDVDYDLLPDGWEIAHGLSIMPGPSNFLDDTDGDGLYDWQEYDAQTNPRDGDSDNDGLNDGADKWPNNKLYNTDSDNDGLPDYFENQNLPYLDMNNPDDVTEDLDGDTLTIVQEFNLGTDWETSDTDGDGADDNLDVAPLNPAYTIDSDGDGLPDEYEIEKGLLPDHPPVIWWEFDFDNDGLSNLREYQLGTEPTGFNCGCDPQDSDNDFVDDAEDRYPADPTEQFDWDMDGMPDNWEWQHGLNYNNNDGFGDPDSDGITNLYEYLNGTDPQVSDADSDGDGVPDVLDAFPADPTESSDTDSDGAGNNADSDDDNDQMPDSWELQYGFDPLANDAEGDADSDGYSNYEEYKAGTDPQDNQSHPVVSVKNDYNSDGIAGWLWLGDSNGNETLSQNWQLTFPLYSEHWGVPNRFYHPVFPDQANWEVITSGDFNKDGDADVLWRNLTTAQWKVWQMQNGLRVGQSNWTDTFDPLHQWTVIGAGDTDKDGDDDIILNKVSTGEVMIWEMQDHVVVATHSVGTKAGYTVNRIGDFNKDGDVDLLLRQNGDDVLITWELQANAFVQERSLNGTGAGYNPVCAGDFDSDGDDDILLINSTTQQEKWFVMENYTRSQRTGSFNTGFVFLGCGDYDGDGDADSLWQRSSDDKIRVILQQDYGIGKQTVFTNAFGGTNGFVYRGNRN